MSRDESAVAAAYSAWAENGAPEPETFWSRLAREVLAKIDLAGAACIADVGCGTGAALAELAARRDSGARLVGVEPSAGMRARAAARLRGVERLELLAGEFEALPLEDASVDLLLGLWSFHWTADGGRGAAEIARVLAPSGRVELLFTARRCGEELRAATSPVVTRHLGLGELARAGRRRLGLELEGARALFERALGPERVRVTEIRRVVHESLEDHWRWLLAEGQLGTLDGEARDVLEFELRAALAALEEAGRIPYRLHALRVSVGPEPEGRP